LSNLSALLLLGFLLPLARQATPALAASGGPARVVVFLQGVCSAITGDSGKDDAIFQPLRTKLTRDYGYHTNQFLD
jgi:hypothetical protein